MRRVSVLLPAMCVVALSARLHAGQGGTLKVVSDPPDAKVFVRTGGHNGFAEVGTTPLTLSDLAPGLLEYTLLHDGWQLYDGSLWIEAGKEHVEKAALKPGRVFYVASDGDDAGPGTEKRPWPRSKRAIRSWSLREPTGRNRPPSVGLGRTARAWPWIH